MLSSINDSAGVPSVAPSSLTQIRANGARLADHIAPDCRGLNFFAIDQSVQDLLAYYMDPALLHHLRPHLDSLGEVAGGELSALSDVADKNPPVLRSRDRFGRDEEWVEYHPAYRRMEQIAYGDFGIHAMMHRAGVLGWPEKMPALAKHVFHYVFVQGEFGLLCPLNMTDSTSEALRLYGNDEIRAQYLDAMWTQDLTKLKRGAQFLTEKPFGSDLGSAELTAVKDGAGWRLHGDKWFCSSADADVILLLARPAGAPAGYSGLGLFMMPKVLADGTRNGYRIVRLKDKLGTRSMATGELLLDGAVAYPLGDVRKGLKQMLVMVNASRLSHLNRAAGMMRRCLNEALQASTHRHAFGGAVIDHPLMRRQIMKMMVPTEQALSAMMFSASITGMDDLRTHRALRMLTPIAKYRASRDNITVATGAMEARGGNGFIEDWPNARLIRDAHVGLLWEGTSNINGIDAIRRGVGKERAHLAMQDLLTEKLGAAKDIPVAFRERLEQSLAQACSFAEEAAASAHGEPFFRIATGRLYHAATAILMAIEGAATASARGDARRMLLARFVLDHRFTHQNEIDLDAHEREERAITAILGKAPISLEEACDLVTADA